MPDNMYCTKCTMKFKIGEPHGEGEKTKCSVPDCDRPYWHQEHHTNGGIVVRTGMYPADAAAYLEVG